MNGVSHGEGPEERIVSVLEKIRTEMEEMRKVILEEIHTGVGEAKKAAADMAGKLVEKLAYLWPPVLIIREVETGKLVPFTDLRVNESYQLLLRGRGVEKEVKMKIEGRNMSRFFESLNVELKPGSGDDQGWWVGELRPKDGFKEGGFRLFFSRKVEGTLKVLVNGKIDVMRPLIIRRPLSRWFYAVVATALWLVVGLIIKVLDILASLLSFLTFAGGVAVGVLSFILIYMASRSRT